MGFGSSNFYGSGGAFNSGKGSLGGSSFFLMFESAAISLFYVNALSSVGLEVVSPLPCLGMSLSSVVTDASPFGSFLFKRLIAVTLEGKNSSSNIGFASCFLSIVMG